MLVHENTIYATSEEIAMLKQSARFDGVSMAEVSEALLKLASAFCNCFEELAKFEEQTQEFKQEPKRFRCRICGRSFFFKGDAKACMRGHRQWRR